MALSVHCEIYMFIKYTYFHAILLICVPAQFHHNVCRANFFCVGGGVVVVFGNRFAVHNLSGNGHFILSRV